MMLWTPDLQITDHSGAKTYGPVDVALGLRPMALPHQYPIQDFRDPVRCEHAADGGSNDEGHRS